MNSGTTVDLVWVKRVRLQTDSFPPSCTFSVQVGLVLVSPRREPPEMAFDLPDSPQRPKLQQKVCRFARTLFYSMAPKWVRKYVLIRQGGSAEPGVVLWNIHLPHTCKRDGATWQ